MGIIFEKKDGLTDSIRSTGPAGFETKISDYCSRKSKRSFQRFSFATKQDCQKERYRLVTDWKIIMRRSEGSRPFPTNRPAVTL